MTAHPRWLIGFLRCDAGRFVEASRVVGQAALKGLSRSGFPCAFYEFDASSGDIVLYGARWNGCDDAAALARFRAVLERAGGAAGLELREAKPYTGLPLDAFGGPATIEEMEDFARLGSAACMAFIRKNAPGAFKASRFLFAMLLSDTVMNALGFSRREKVQFLTDWHAHQLERGGRMMRQLDTEISYPELDRLYDDRRPYWRNIFTGEAVDMDFVRRELNPTVHPILKAYASEIVGPARRARAKREDPSLTRPFWQIALKRFIHVNWIRLDIYNQYEMMFNYVLRRLHADGL